MKTPIHRGGQGQMGGAGLGGTVTSGRTQLFLWPRPFGAYRVWPGEPGISRSSDVLREASNRQLMENLSTVKYWELSNNDNKITVGKTKCFCRLHLLYALVDCNAGSRGVCC